MHVTWLSCVGCEKPEKNWEKQYTHTNMYKGYVNPEDIGVEMKQTCIMGK